ncbi:type III-A CRISPR-associated protein Cas10/Csm1 [Benzoatithermus flavus]|uniref:CRISPR system single-strand-specific deoxyribonuclease Cas10/Csm1 (subtype III-A) n=1 Tax=Benzoatithermus flavus TaxID=3108223 RepID=A0ABU8XVR7_9PROT
MNGLVPPSLDDLAAGAFLHDIGKLYQRAAGSERDLPEMVRNLESEVLPLGEHGRYTHRHALFTAAFFAELEQAHLELPRGLDLEQTRVCAVYHHKPDDSRPWTWIVAEADRLSSGMDRKTRDIADELGLGPRGRDAYRRTPLLSLVSTVELGLGTATPRAFPVAELTPDAILPVHAPDPGTLPEAYLACWRGFRQGIDTLCSEASGSGELFHEGLISLSERFTWAVPSSTMDEPDVSLHDHSLSVAAIAACLHAWHTASGSLTDLTAIRDRRLPKFRLLEGDLSGIQSTLFRLARQQVKGVNRILRARSFLLGALVETAALLIRREFELPPYVTLQHAGGKFLMLLPALEGLDERLAALQARIDRWLVETYAGDLALTLALGPAFGGEGFSRGRWRETHAALRHVAEQAKLRPLASVMHEPVLRGAEYEEGAEGACPACGVRPARVADERDPALRRCVACDTEERIGAVLPAASAVIWKALRDDDPTPFRPFGLAKAVIVPGRAPHASGHVLSAWQPRPREWAWPPADRFVANHVPRFAEGEWDDDRYRGILPSLEDIGRPREDTVKTMAHLACEDLELDGHGRLLGRPMLAVLKADVDRLGQVFGRGLGKDRTIGRVVALSRLMDAFFTGHLTRLLEQRFANVYTVYAGGDDLLLIGPWLTTIRLARELNAAFARFSGGNPNLTLSAGIELLAPEEPLNRAAARAEARLTAAKDAGRNRVSLIVREPLTWPALDKALALADRLNALLRRERDPLPTALAYKLLHFADLRLRAEAGDPNAAIWRARLAYQLARAKAGPEAEALVNELLPPPGQAAPVPARIPITMALYRNR